jgi:DNA uptake protein ComE-like DNA-binding protein
MKRSSLLSSLAVAVALTVPFAAMAAQNGTTGSSTPPASTPAAAPAKTTTTTSTKSAKSSSTKSTEHKAAAVKPDINSAAKDDLMKVKGMTDADADKIIAGRPYKSVNDLKSKKIIDATVYGHVHSHLACKKAA